MKIILYIKLYKTDLIYNFYPIYITDILNLYLDKLFKLDRTLKHLQINV